jgi:hypothetical protein
MNLKAKVYAQESKQAAEKNLAARIALLESKGTPPKTIQKDTVVRKLKADIRDSNKRLAGVAAMENLLAQKVQNKEAKAAAEKEAAQKPAGKPAAKPDQPEKKEKKAKEKKKPAAPKA